MERNTLYVWVHPDFAQVDAPEVNGWRRAILGLRNTTSSGLVLVPWNFKKKPSFNDLNSLYSLAQSTLGNRFFSWTRGQFICPGDMSKLPRELLSNKQTARCYGLQPSFCVQDQTDYLINSRHFNQVINEGYYPYQSFQ